MIITGDCKHMLKCIPSESFDSLVTDPPYGLSKHPDMREVLSHWLAGDDFTATGGGFMGKSWDSFVPGPATWAEVLRVLKPGAFGAVFAGSRTVDLMATSLRLAGFEVVDMLHWLYGSGFPKSLDISKAVDSLDAKKAKRERQYRFTAWMREVCPLSSKQIDQVLDTNGMGRHFRDVPPGGKQPEVATREHFEALRPSFTQPVPAWVEELVDERTTESENMKRREVIGEHESPAQAAQWRGEYDQKTASSETVGKITKAYSPEAQEWGGFGTALKPAYEPVIIVRKPTPLTYAENVTTHGTGALNIDGCRNGDRWPANILHDGCLPEPMDRYFYCAKATKADREDGLQDFEAQSAGDVTGGRKEGSAGLSSPRAGAGRTSGAKNVHPTVKPTELMRWLCRLITPPGGAVLDPFAGSGSTGRGAVLEGFDFMGFELSEEYAQIARARIDAALDKR